ncbi:hypothetical protein, partial [Plantactinospora alkalitolerans]|uniref:hypothetical protein n=1 Tax=Plantactinospora alkalitolerans TaxID=2789879 RepID=UPI001E4052BE
SAAILARHGTEQQADIVATARRSRDTTPTPPAIHRGSGTPPPAARGADGMATPRSPEQRGHDGVSLREAAGVRAVEHPSTGP